MTTCIGERCELVPPCTGNGRQTLEVERFPAGQRHLWQAGRTVEPFPEIGPDEASILMGPCPAQPVRSDVGLPGDVLAFSDKM